MANRSQVRNPTTGSSGILAEGLRETNGEMALLRAELSAAQDDMKALISDFRKEYQEILIHLQGKSAEVSVAPSVLEGLAKNIVDLRQEMRSMRDELASTRKEYARVLAQQGLRSSDASSTDISSAYIVEKLADVSVTLTLTTTSLENFSKDMLMLKTILDQFAQQLNTVVVDATVSALTTVSMDSGMARWHEIGSIQRATHTVRLNAAGYAAIVKNTMAAMRRMTLESTESEMSRTELINSLGRLGQMLDRTANALNF